MLSKKFIPNSDQFGGGSLSLVQTEPMSIVQLTGEDAFEWLQGQATNDINRLHSEQIVEFCLCNSMGAILAPIIGVYHHEMLLLVLPTCSLHSLLERLETHVVMEEVQGIVRTDLHLFSLQGTSSGISVDTLIKRGSVSEEVISYPCSRSREGGYDLLIGEETEKLIKSEIKRVSFEESEVLRLQAGLPSYGCDMQSRVFPVEFGELNEARWMSYNKGCYTGQEVLMRLHSRGHVNRTWGVWEVRESEIPIDATAKFQIGANKWIVSGFRKVLQEQVQ